MTKPPDNFLLKEEPKNLLKVKQKSLIKLSPTRKDKTEISKTQDSCDNVTKETVQQINLSNSGGVNNAETSGKVIHSSTQTNFTPSNYDLVQAETDKIQDGFVDSGNYETGVVNKYNQARINKDLRRTLGPPRKQSTKVENRKSNKLYSFCNGDVKESIHQDNALLSHDTLDRFTTDPTCVLQEGHCPTLNDNSDNVTVEELSSILLDVASSLGKAPTDVKKMIVSDMHPPETLKEFINTITYLTENQNYINEVGRSGGLSSILNAAPIDEEEFISKQYFDDSDASGIDSKFISAKNKFSNSTCYTDTSVGTHELNKKFRKRNSDVVNRIANMYYDTEFEHLKGARKNRRKRLITDKSEYILLKPNEIQNKIKKVMKKYIDSFEKFMEEEIQKQSSEENKFKVKSGSLSVDEKAKAKSYGRMISYCFLFFVVVSIVCAVGYSLYLKDMRISFD